MNDIKKPAIHTTDNRPVAAKQHDPVVATTPTVSDREFTPDPKAGETYFVVRVKEEYLSNSQGSRVTPYFKSAYRFDDYDCALSQAIKAGGQLHLGSRNHSTAKRLLSDFSPLY